MFDFFSFFVGFSCCAHHCGGGCTKTPSTPTSGSTTVTPSGPSQSAA